MPRPCRAAKGLECLSHFIYTVRPCLIHTCRAAPMPCSDHAVLLKATAQHGRPETACGLPARVRLLPANTRGSTKVIRRMPISDAGGQFETKRRLSWTRKRVAETHYKKTLCSSVGEAVRIFPATMRTSTKDTALSEQGRGAAWQLWINARHGHGMLCVNRPLPSADCKYTLFSKRIEFYKSQYSVSRTSKSQPEFSVTPVTP